LSPRTAPPPRVYHAMAWDSISNRVILFGGVSHLYEPVLDDTWAYDYEQNTWKEFTPKAHPSARAWHVMVSAPLGVLMFGGSPQHDPSTYNDTWIYDYKSDQWNEVSPCKRSSGEGVLKR
jgi:N-acetylneuraminic acid mutarotase